MVVLVYPSTWIDEDKVHWIWISGIETTTDDPPQAPRGSTQPYGLPRGGGGLGPPYLAGVLVHLAKSGPGKFRVLIISGIIMMCR